MGSASNNSLTNTHLGEVAMTKPYHECAEQVKISNLASAATLRR